MTKARELSELGSFLNVESGVATVNNMNVTANLQVSVVVANGSIGTAGQMLTSNGTGVYWLTPQIGDITNVIAGTGLTGGGSSGEVTISLSTSGVVANTYGNSSQIPVLTVDTYGRVTNVSTTAVAGVTNFTYAATNSTFTISTGDGSTFLATITAANATTQGVVTVLDSLVNTSILIAASANSVKTAYDTAISANTRAASAQTAAISAYSNATSYADSVAGTAYSNAVSVASTDATNKAANAYSNAVSTAASDATTKANNAYTTAVAAAASDATNKAANAYSNAVSYAATIAGTAYSNAVSTAASDATSKANNAYTTAVAAAASDATTKANNAYTTAVAVADLDATTKANNAYTTAVAAAASDATTKANNAYTTAVSAASTDATNKAANAYSNATTFASNASNISSGTLAEARLPFRMNQNVRTTDSPTFANGSFTGSVSIGGDLIVTGNVESTNVQSLAVADPLMKLGVGNASDVYWGGFTFHYSGSGNTTNHAGLVRDPSNKEFILMSTYGDETNVANNNSINIADPTFSYANLQVNIVKAGNASVFSTVNATSFTGTANNTLFVGSVAAANVVSNTQLSSNLANYQTTAGLSANVATLTSNNATYFNGIASSRFVYGDNGSGSTLASNTQDVYEVAQRKSGFWDAQPGANWTPDSGAYWWGATFAHVSNGPSYNYSGQLAFKNGLGGNQIYARTISNGSPSAWTHMLSAGNYTSYAMPIGSLAVNTVGVSAPVFYDSADSNYFIDLKDQFNNTYLKSGGGFFVDATSHNFRAAADSSTWAQINSDYLIHNSDIRSPLFYDSDNTAYYLDPASTSTLNVQYTNRYFQRASGTPTNNLGDPTVTEMALFDQQFTNKTEFFPPANVIFETSTDGSTWTTYTVTDAQKRIFVGGDDYASIGIPYGTPYFRIRFVNDGNYVFLNALYSYWASQGHQTKVQIYTKDFGSSTWNQYTFSNELVSSWPGHLYLPFQTIAYHPGTYVDQVAVVFIPTWNPSFSSNAIALYKMQIWGGYPAGKRTIYAVNSVRDVTFPANVLAPIYYDSADTTYYVDPASGSTLRSVYVRDGGIKLERAYNDNAVWFAGGNDSNHAVWNDYFGGPGTRGAAGSGFDGIKWNAYQGIQIRGGLGGAYNLIVAQNSSGGSNDHTVELYAANVKQFETESGYALATNEMRAPIFYDSNNTNFYADLAGTTNLNFLQIQGGIASTTDSPWYYDAAIEIRERNFGGAQADSFNNAPRLGFHWGGRVAMQLALGSDTILNVMNGDTSGFTAFRAGDMYGNAFYDRNNTSYYCDPNSISRFSSFILGGNETYVYEGSTNGLNIRTGATGAFKYFGFESGGRFVTSNGGIFSGGYFQVEYNSGNQFAGMGIRNNFGSASAQATNFIDFINENGIQKASLFGRIATDGAGYLEFLSTAAGVSRSTDSRTTTAYAYFNQWQFQTAAGITANIFYDRDNTGFYLDPNSTTNLSGLSVANTISGYVSGAKFSNDSENKADISTRTESGFWQSDTGTTAEGWPLNDSSWQHMISSTHSNDANYFAMQLASSFYSQGLFYRATNGSGATAWSRVALYDNAYSSNLRATIFYDNDNTGYFIDGNGTSVLAALRVNYTAAGYVLQDYGWLVAQDSSARGISIGYDPSADRTWFYSRHVGVAGKPISLNDILIVGAGGGFTFSAGSVRTPIFYDSDNTGFYVDAASTTNLNAFQCGNFVSSDGAPTWTNEGLQYSEHLSSHLAYYKKAGIYNYYWRRSDSGYAGGANDTTMMQLNDSGTLTVLADVRAPIFYDSNDTGYYIDPNTTATSINVRGEINNPTLWVNDGDNSNSYNEGIRLRDAPNGISVIALSAAGAAGEPRFSLLSYSTYLETRRAGTWETRLYADYEEARGSYRAPIFYDSNNTGYYINPNGTSVLYNMEMINMRCSFSRQWDNYPGISVYNTTDQGPQGDFRIFGSVGANGGDFSVRLLVDGEITSLSNVNAGGAMYSPIYYDSNNTGYYYDGAGTSVLNTTYVNGKFYARGGVGVDECCGSDATISVGGSAARPPSISWHYSGVMQGNMQGNQTGWRKIYFYDDQGNGLGVHATGQIASNADVIAYYSDKRLKKDLVRVVDHWNVINNLTGYRFTWNEKSGEIPGFQDKVGKREVGLIAQDVQAVYPEAIAMRTEGPEDDPYMTIKHDRFTAVFIEALKDLRRELDEVKEENKRLREMINGQ